MFNRLKNDISDFKPGNALNKSIQEFKFFSKVTKTDSENLINAAKAIEETNNSNIKMLKIQNLREKIQDTSVAELIKYMKCDIDILRTLAAQAFAECGSPNLIDCMSLMLKDTNDNLRLACLEAIIHLEDPETLPLLKQAIKDNSSGVRLKAAICLAELSRLGMNSEAINILNFALNDPDKEVREFVIDELGLIGNEKSLVKILEALEKTQGDEKDLLNESLSLIMSRAVS
jgi:HEAT repeat protein